MNYYAKFYYTTETDGNPTLVVDVELPGVDPKNVKLGFYDTKIQINNHPVAHVNKRFDLKQAKAELKHGLLTIKIPENIEGKGEIPLVVS